MPIAGQRHLGPKLGSSFRRKVPMTPAWEFVASRPRRGPPSKLSAELIRRMKENRSAAWELRRYRAPLFGLPNEVASRVRAALPYGPRLFAHFGLMNQGGRHAPPRGLSILKWQEP